MSSIFTNRSPGTATFFETIKKELENSEEAVIASGYVSRDVLEIFENNFYEVNQKGRFRLLLGMAFYEGLPARSLEQLKNVHNILSADGKNGGVFVMFSRRFHGKIYKFSQGEEERHYLGSSNFSRSGLTENLEGTARISESGSQEEINTYLDYLLSSENSVAITEADITVPGTDEYKKRIALTTLDDLEKYDPSTIATEDLAFFDYPLRRIAEKEKSNLNVYFGKGRLARGTGKVRPRPWYEIELIANAELREGPLYPKGNFIAKTDDGYVIEMYTGGDNYKNIRSRHNLRIFGQWLKGKLQKNGALVPLTPVTPDTLDVYGKDFIRFYKIQDNEYRINF